MTLFTMIYNDYHRCHRLSLCCVILTYNYIIIDPFRELNVACDLAPPQKPAPRNWSVDMEDGEMLFSVHTDELFMKTSIRTSGQGHDLSLFRPTQPNQ